jgi:glycosyltransferase involved in cell wall biosynthesis
VRSNIGICGHFNIGSDAVGGQTIKTRIISETLSEVYGADDVQTLDTANWKRKAPLFFFQCIRLAHRSENIIILPAQNGIKVLIPLFVFMSKIFKNKVHYIVVGAWLADSIEENPFLLKQIKRIDYVYPQTATLKEKLDRLGVCNTYLMPNFKNVAPVNPKDFDLHYQEPFKLCVMSRINQEKGIDSAIQVVRKLNQKHNSVFLKLDIYGPIDKDYETEFHRLVRDNRSFVSYKGVVDYNNTVDTLKEYYLLLFPTRYYTEGFPGTILDAYLSGLPVLASRWESWADVIEEGRTGYSYEFNNEDDFLRKLEFLVANPDRVASMRINCINRANQYRPESAIKVLIQNLGL